MPSSVLDILVKVSDKSLEKLESNLKSTGDAAADMEKKASKGHATLSKVGKAAGVASLAIGGALFVGLKKSVDAAKEAQISQAKLETTLKALGIDYKDHAAQIDKVIQATSKLAALDDEDLQDSFTKLVRATGDVNKSLKDTQLAANLARGANISLEAATKAITGAELGRETALKKLGIAVPKVTTSTDEMKEAFEAYKKTHKTLTAEEDNRWKRLLDTAKATDKNKTAQDALAQATKKYAGAAEAYGKTAAGSQERFKVALENVEESIGSGLLPALTKIMTYVDRVTEFFSEHEKVTKIVVIAIAAFAVALGVTSIAASLLASTLVTAVIPAVVSFTAALLANPIGLIVIALVALGVGLYEAYQHFEPFRNAVNATWQALQDAYNWITANWPLLAAVLAGPFAPLVLLATNGLGIRTKIENEFTAIVTFLKGLPAKIGGAIGDFANAGRSLATNLAKGISNGIAGIAGDIKETINKAVSALENLGAGAFNQGKQLANKIFAGLKDGLGDLGEAISGIAIEAGKSVSSALKTLLNKLLRYLHDHLSFHIPGFNVSLLGHSVGWDGYNFGFPLVQLARGGIVTAPTMALIGEKGPEAVVPLNKGWGSTINVYVAGSVSTERDLVDAIHQGLLQKQQRGSLGWGTSKDPSTDLGRPTFAAQGLAPA